MGEEMIMDTNENETPMQRMQREALEEQAADAAARQGETPMQRMQREALEEQAAADAAAGLGVGKAPVQDDGDSIKPAQATSKQPSLLRLRLNRYLFGMDNPVGKFVNYSILALILASVFLSMLDTLPTIHSHWDTTITAFQVGVLWLFMCEYLLRVYAAHDRRKYVLSLYGIVDLLTVLPLLFGGPGSAIMRLARLIRIMKLTQYFPVLGTLLRSVSGATHMIMAVIVTIAAVSIFAGNVAYMIEPETFHNAFIGTWWSLVTMSTVGYGDLVPHSGAGMALGGALILIGICVVAMMTAVIAVRVGRMVNMNKKCFECEKSISSEFGFCPHCGQDQSDEIDLFSDDE